MMLIEQVLPQVIQALGNLRDCLKESCRSKGFSEQQTNELIAIVPSNLLVAGCFLDNLKNLWRYEFGLPADLKQTNTKLWGTTMWPPVDELVEALNCAKQKLNATQLATYMQRIATLDKHQDALVEMFPVLRLENTTATDFEVVGEGVGNKTIDWKIGPTNNRFIRLDVKNRMKDLYSMLDQNKKQGPQHDPALLFLSVESKFLATDPDIFLQGVWVVTQVQQDEKKLTKAFDDLDAGKVHFAILGDYRNDAHILVKREQDRKFIMNQLCLASSNRFTF